MAFPESEQRQHNWERTMTPMDGDREPQLNCTVCGKRTGFSGCLCSARNEDGSDTDKTEDMEETYFNGQEGVEEVDAVIVAEIPRETICEMTFFSTRWTGFLHNEDGFHHCDRDVTDGQVLARALQELEIDGGDGAMTPPYMENQYEMEMSLSSSEMLSRRSHSPGTMLREIGSWMEGVRESHVFAPLSLTPVWQFPANARPTLLADQVEQTDHPESIAEEDFEYYGSFGDI